MRHRALTMLVVMLLLVGCGGKEVLLAKPAAIPAGVDLSGHWLLRGSSGSEQPSARETLVHVFLETGKSVKVTQTNNGLFISFDRSVVEEYRFGEHRNISVGEISADRVSGWQGEAYVIETLDKDGAKLTDSYRLLGGGEELQRTIRIESRNKNHMSLEQVFDRV